MEWETFKAKAGLSKENESKACKFLIEHAAVCFLLSKLLQIFKAKAVYLKESPTPVSSFPVARTTASLQPISPEALATLSTLLDSPAAMAGKPRQSVSPTTMATCPHKQLPR